MLTVNFSLDLGLMGLAVFVVTDGSYSGTPKILPATSIQVMKVIHKIVAKD